MTDPEHLTFSYTDNPDGWVTAQIVEFPAAISQGPSREEAMMNALDALHDLTHEPTSTERLVVIVVAALEELEELGRAVARDVWERLSAAADKAGHSRHLVP